MQDELNFLRNIQIFKKNSAKYCVKYISQDLMGSIPVRLTSARCHFHLPQEFAGPRRTRQRKKHPALGVFFSLVDPRGVEPLSESLFTGPSPWAVCDLAFPLNGGHRQSPIAGSPFMHDRYKCELSMHVHHYMTLRSGPWYSPRERVAIMPQPCP